MIRAGLYDGLKSPDGQTVSAKDAKLYFTTSFEDLVKQFEGDAKEVLEYLKAMGIKVAILTEDYKVRNESGDYPGDAYLKEADIIISTTQTLATAMQSGNHANGVFKPGYLISDEADQTKFYQFDINSIISVSNDGITSPFLAKKIKYSRV
jgi:ABC-type transport system substrate-binding protein